jgi:hypothetical protein
MHECQPSATKAAHSKQLLQWIQACGIAAQHPSSCTVTNVVAGNHDNVCWATALSRRYQQKEESGSGPEASSEAKLAQMTEQLPCANWFKLFWQLFSALPGCDAADTVHHGATPILAPAAQAPSVSSETSP